MPFSRHNAPLGGNTKCRLKKRRNYSSFGPQRTGLSAKSDLRAPSNKNSTAMILQQFLWEHLRFKYFIHAESILLGLTKQVVRSLSLPKNALQKSSGPNFRRNSRMR